MSTTELLQGTLNLLILKAISLGHQHGYGILLRIQQVSRDRLQIQQGFLYPALYRLEHQGLMTSEWGESENKQGKVLQGRDAPASTRSRLLGTDSRGYRLRTPGLTLGASGFGEITSARDPRIVQVGAKIIW
jgi:hypothetical protein